MSLEPFPTRIVVVLSVKELIGLFQMRTNNLGCTYISDFDEIFSHERRDQNKHNGYFEKLKFFDFKIL